MLVTFVKTAALTEMSFGGLTYVSPRNHVLDGGPDTQRKGQLLGIVQPIQKHALYAAKNQ